MRFENRIKNFYKLANLLVENKKITAKDIAYMYAESGIDIFPIYHIENGSCSCPAKQCKSKGKHPQTNKGFQDASTNIQILNIWFQNKILNLGMPTGNGIYILDIDPRNGGLDSFETIQKKYKFSPQTLTVKTGGNGYHCYYKSYLDLPKVGNLYPGIDFLGRGSYAIIPPSNHISGNNYSWSAKYKFLDDLPEFIIADIRNRNKTHEKSNWEAYSLEKIPEGQRNEKITKLAGLLINKLNPTLALNLVNSWNLSNCEPPLIEKEILAIVESIVRKEQRKNKRASL